MIPDHVCLGHAPPIGSASFSPLTSKWVCLPLTPHGASEHLHKWKMWWRNRRRLWDISDLKVLFKIFNPSIYKISPQHSKMLENPNLRPNKSLNIFNICQMLTIWFSPFILLVTHKLAVSQKSNATHTHARTHTHCKQPLLRRECLYKHSRALLRVWGWVEQ